MIWIATTLLVLPAPWHHIAAAANVGFAQQVLATEELSLPESPIFEDLDVSVAALPLPNGPLPWSDLNILSTTVRSHSHPGLLESG